MKQIYLVVIIMFATIWAYKVQAAATSFNSEQLGCDANSGVSPREVFLCGTEIFNLYALLTGPLDAGGSWSGPIGWSGNGTSDGPINPAVDSFGTYTYAVTGTDGCISETTIHIVINELGILAYKEYCGSSSIELFLFLNDDSFPSDGVWVAPNGTIVPQGTVNTLNSESGDYTFLFNDENGCQSSGILNIMLGGGYDSSLPFDAIDFTVCDPFESVCFTEFLDDPEEIAQYFGGQWIVETADGVFLAFFADMNPCEILSEWFDLDVDLVFTLGLSAPPCTPHIMESLVHFDPINQFGDTTSTAVCINYSEANLNSYLPISVDPNGYWVDETGDSIPGTIDPGNYEANSNTYFSYISPNDDGCQRLDAVDVSFLAPSEETCACQYSVEMTSSETVICGGDEVDIFVEFTDGDGPFNAIVSSGGSDIEISGETSPIIYTVSPVDLTSYTLLAAEDFNCSSAASDVVTISVENIQMAGADIYWEYCATDGMLNLIDILDDAADNGGSFLPESSINLSTENSGTYMYVVGGPVCPSDTAILTIELPVAASASNVVATCSVDSLSFIVSYEMNGGSHPFTSEPGGTWNGALFVSNPIPITASGGSVQFFVSDDGPCPSLTVFASILDDDGENLCDQLVGTSLVATERETMFLFPNPWSGIGSLGIRLNGLFASDQMLTVEFTDLSGRMVYQQEIHYQQGSEMLHISPDIALSDGVYLVSLHSTIGKYTSKLVISQ